jgi:hypothetical protein
MPTVIDALIVELKLDSSKFDEGQKKAVEGLRKMEEASGKHLKPVNAEFDKLLGAFKEMQGRLLGIGALIAGGLGLDRLIGDITKLNAETGYLAKSLGISAQELAKWENAGATVGATANDIAGGIASIEKSFATMQLHGEGPLQKFAYATGLNFYKGNGQAQSPTEILMTLSEWAQKQKPAVATQALSELGLGQGLIRLLQLGPQELEKRLRAVEKFGPTDEQIQKFQALQEAFAKLTISVDQLTRNIVSELEPAFIKILSWIGKLAEVLGHSSSPEVLERESGGFPPRSLFGRGYSRLRGWFGGSGASFGDRFGQWSGTAAGGGSTPAAPGAVGSSSNSGSLADQRQRFATEMQNNPGLRDKIMRIMANEEGNSPSGGQAIVESMMNRALVRGTSLEQQARWVGEGGYYQEGNMGRGANREILGAAIDRALAGSNVANFATDNSSQGLAERERASGKFRYRAGGPGGVGVGDTYFAPGWGEPSLVKRWDDWHSAVVAADRVARTGAGSTPPLAVMTPGASAARTFANWASINRLTGARSALDRGGDTTTNNSTSASSTHIGEMHVTVPPGASADDYAHRIQGVLQRNDPVQQAVTGQR